MEIALRLEKTSGLHCGPGVLVENFAYNLNVTENRHTIDASSLFLPTDSILFEYWFEHYLMAEVKKGSVIILDNATFHRKTILIEIAQRFGCIVWFLPPYSPDLNPIEKRWAWLKRKLRDTLHNFLSLDDALSAAFQDR